MGSTAGWLGADVGQFAGSEGPQQTWAVPVRFAGWTE